MRQEPSLGVTSFEGYDQAKGAIVRNLRENFSSARFSLSKTEAASSFSASCKPSNQIEGPSHSILWQCKEALN